MTKREQWIIANQMAAAVMGLNAPFCEEEGQPQEPPEYFVPIVDEVAAKTTTMALQDAMDVLGCALAKRKFHETGKV